MLASLLNRREDGAEETPTPSREPELPEGWPRKLAFRKRPKPNSRAIHWMPTPERPSLQLGAGARDASRPYELFVTQAVLREVRQHLITSSSSEPFGFLIGQVVYCPWTEAPYVLVDGVRRETQSLPSSTEVDRFRHAWIAASRDARHRRAQLVGWYHKHGVLGLRMSEWDLKLQDEFFPEPWQCALIIASADGPIGGFIQRSHRARLFRKGLAPFHELIDLDAKPVDGLAASVVDWGNYRPDTAVHVIEAAWPEPDRTAREWSHGGDDVVSLTEASSRRSEPEAPVVEPDDAAPDTEELSEPEKGAGPEPVEAQPSAAIDDEPDVDKSDEVSEPVAESFADADSDAEADDPEAEAADEAEAESQTTESEAAEEEQADEVGDTEEIAAAAGPSDRDEDAAAPDDATDDMQEDDDVPHAAERVVEETAEAVDVESAEVEDVEEAADVAEEGALETAANAEADDDAGAIDEPDSSTQVDEEDVSDSEPDISAEDEPVDETAEEPEPIEAVDDAARDEGEHDDEPETETEQPAATERKAPEPATASERRKTVGPEGIPVVLVEDEPWRPSFNIVRIAAAAVVLLGIGFAVRYFTADPMADVPPRPAPSTQPVATNAEPPEFSQLAGAFRSSLQDFRSLLLDFTVSESSCDELATGLFHVEARHAELSAYAATQPAVSRAFSMLDSDFRGASQSFAGTSCERLESLPDTPAGDEALTPGAETPSTSASPGTVAPPIP